MLYFRSHVENNNIYVHTLPVLVVRMSAEIGYLLKN